MRLILYVIAFLLAMLVGALVLDGKQMVGAVFSFFLYLIVTLARIK